MAPLFLLLFLSISFSQSQSSDDGFISAIISEKGLNFVKDLLIEQELKALVPLKLPVIEKAIKIPIIGTVHVSADNITLSHINVSDSTVHPGDSGVVIAVSGATAALSLNWRYSYSKWVLIPIKISDEGTASVQVEGMEVGLTITIKNRNGTLDLILTECGCYMKDLSITLEGGESWLYQGFVNAFKSEIRSAVETAITKKIIEGVSKLDLLLQSLPTKIDVDDDVALNVTFVNDPIFGDSSLEFDINGLLVPSDKVSLHKHSYKKAHSSISCFGLSKMLGISLDEAVFNSASLAYFQAGSMHFLVDKVPEQSLLNTAKWRFIIPRLYKKYPNEDMELNFTLISPPAIRIDPQGIGATIIADMIVNVLDSGGSIPVACITVDVAASGVVEISGNNLAGKAYVDGFGLNLKWSDVGNFHMSLIQGVVRVFLKTVLMPLVNSHLRRGFPLPIIHGFTIKDADILISSSKVAVCSDVLYSNSGGGVVHLPMQNYSSMPRWGDQ